MDLTTETDIELTLLFEERTEDPCEHSNHDDKPRFHAGVGEWLVRATSICCNTSTDILVCNRFKVKVIDQIGIQSFSFFCTHCQRTTTNYSYEILGHKGVDF